MIDIAIRRQQREEILFMDEILSRVDSDGVVLDAGCGDCSFDYRLFSFRVLGIDSSVSPRHSSLPSSGGFVKGDVSRLPFPDEIFSAVFFNWVLEHVADPSACLHEAWRTLRQDGVLYVSIPNGFGVEDRLYRMMFGGGGHIQRYSFQSFCQLAYRAGFRMISFSDWPSGYSWLRTKPGLRHAIFMGLQWLRRAVGVNLAKNANWIMAFKKVDQQGFRSVSHTCAHCGGGANIRSTTHGREWVCPTCGGKNVYV